MFKRFLLLSLLLVLPILGRAEPFVSPNGCLAIAQDIYLLTQVRDMNISEEEVLKTIPTEDKVAHAFYSYWIKLVFASGQDPQTMAQVFYNSCIKEKGDIAKLYGLEV